MASELEFLRAELARLTLERDAALTELEITASNLRVMTGRLELVHERYDKLTSENLDLRLHLRSLLGKEPKR